MAIVASGETLRHTGSLCKFVGILILLTVLPSAAPAFADEGPTVDKSELKCGIPERANDDLTGSQFAQSISKMNPEQREEAIRREILKGNVPEFLRKLAPVQLQCPLPGGKIINATIFVTPDYLAVGSDADFLRVPMNLHTALTIADQLGFALPTKKMVDAIYLQSRHHLVPQPLPAGPEMRSTAYYWNHNRMIQTQADSLGVQLGDLIAGHKKDVVITNRLTTRAGKIAIYGWHRAPGQPIQPLSTVHGANYADYSHGIRLVSGTALIEGKPRSIYDILQDPSVASVINDEGVIHNIGEFFPSPHGSLQLHAREQVRTIH